MRMQEPLLAMMTVMMTVQPASTFVFSSTKALAGAFALDARLQTCLLLRACHYPAPLSLLAMTSSSCEQGRATRRSACALLVALALQPLQSYAGQEQLVLREEDVEGSDGIVNKISFSHPASWKYQRNVSHPAWHLRRRQHLTCIDRAARTGRAFGFVERSVL